MTARDTLLVLTMFVLSACSENRRSQLVGAWECKDLEIEDITFNSTFVFQSSGRYQRLESSSSASLDYVTYREVFGTWEMHGDLLLLTSEGGAIQEGSESFPLRPGSMLYAHILTLDADALRLDTGSKVTSCPHRRVSDARIKDS